MTRLLRLSAFALGLAACTRAPPGPIPDASWKSSDGSAGQPWPAWPEHDPDAAIASATRRPISQRIGGGADVRTVLEAALDGGDAIGGWAAIDAWVSARVKASAEKGRSHYLLWGTHHDSVLPIEGFRRLVGATSSVAWTRLVVEQLHADGRWVGIDGETQKGDNARISLWQLNAAKSALDDLEIAQQRDDYAAWKYGYVNAITDLVVYARAMARPLSGCDMPAALQKKLPNHADTRNRLRELHCALALNDLLEREPKPQEVAMLWGEAHVAPEGFMRFLPPDVDVTVARVVTSPEGFAVVDPVLVPPRTDGDDALVVLADPTAGPHIDRVRTFDFEGKTEHNVSLVAKRAGGSDALLAGRKRMATSKPQLMTIAPGDQLLVVPLPSLTVVVVADVPKPKAGLLSIAIERSEPEVSLHYAFPH